MTSIAGVSATTIVAAGSNAPRHDTPPPRAPKASSSRALIALQPVASGGTQVRTHPDARFLAHLIATDQRMPQTRERRRAEPQVATAIYAATNAGPGAPTGVRVFRVM
jgi:hypothetical protein